MPPCPTHATRVKDDSCREFLLWSPVTCSWPLAEFRARSQSNFLSSAILVQEGGRKVVVQASCFFPEAVDRKDATLRQNTFCLLFFPKLESRRRRAVYKPVAAVGSTLSIVSVEVPAHVLSQQIRLCPDPAVMLEAQWELTLAQPPNFTCWHIFARGQQKEQTADGTESAQSPTHSVTFSAE